VSFVVDNVNLSRLEGLLDEFNLFEAIGTVRQEINHSCFLSFLLDPSRNHGLDDYFLKALFKRCLAGLPRTSLTALDIDVADLSDAVVERERWNIDVLVHSQLAQLVLAIENKVDSAEHSDQLNRYRKIVEREFPGYRKALIYLTPDGDPSSDPEHWVPYSYARLLEVLRSVRESKDTLLSDSVKITMKHYETMVGRYIVSDSEIARLCQQIYRQHRTALDLIYEHRPDLQTIIRSALEDVIKSQSEFALDHCSKSLVRFYPTRWDKDLRQKGGDGWTPSKRVVLFEILNGVDNLRLKLIVGPTDIKNAGAAELRNAIIECAKNHKSEFPNGGISPSQKWTTVLSKLLLKKSDYLEPDQVSEKAAKAMKASFDNLIPRAMEKLDGIIEIR
jgi:hypothetical protein